MVGRFTYLFTLIAALVVMSCTTKRNITYFLDISDTLKLTKVVQTSEFHSPKIQPNDVLLISILTLDPTVNAMLEMGSSSQFSVQPATGNNGSTNPQTSNSGFLVDKEGNIELPIIGKINVYGLTTFQARDTIHQKVATYYKNPVVNVRLGNFTVSVLGEVAHPASYVVPGERVSLLDAIAMAGDLTVFGKRENVMLIRDSSGHKEFVRFNLNSSEVIKSPFFYLKPGDIIYIEPNKAKVASSDGVRTRNYALIAAFLTVVITIVSRL